MKKCLKVLVFGFFIYITACASSLDKELIDPSSKISSAKKIGIIVRTVDKSFITIDAIENNFNNWIAAYKKNKEINILRELDSKLITYREQEERFYQKDYENGNPRAFLKYKSIGVIKNYLTKNRGELLRVISENNYDIIFLYEIEYILSLEMQMMRLDSVIVAIDKDLKISYLNYQFEDLETDELDLPSIKIQMTNKISERLIKKLEKVDILNEE